MPFESTRAQRPGDACWLQVIYLRCLYLQGPCHVELQRALEKIAKSQQKLGDKLTRFYLPNCDKHGLYKPKQVGLPFGAQSVTSPRQLQPDRNSCLLSASPSWTDRGVDAGA